MRNVKYMLRVVKLNRQLERWSSRRRRGLLNRPCLLTPSCSATTPAPAIRRWSSEKFSKMADDDIVRHMLTITFSGLR
jgi:hypothetical protein